MDDKTSLLEGVGLAFANAERLFNAAEILANTEQFPIANSLLILAAEEASKAASIKLHAEVKKDDTVFKKIFSVHEVKIDIIKMQTFVSNIIQDMFETELGPLLKFKKTGMEVTPQIFEKLQKEGSENFKNKLISGKLATNEMGWWSNISKEKEDGFYVNYRNNTWKSPQRITEKQYLKTKKHVVSYMQRAKRVCEFDIYESEFNFWREEVRKKML